MELYRKISQVREAKKISRAEMATALNMSSQSYWNVETGKTELTVSRLIEIAEILEVNAIELLTGEVLKEEDNEIIKNLSRRVEELEQMVTLLKQENNRLSHYFLNKFQNSIKEILEEELIRNMKVLYDEELRFQVDKIIKNVTITTQDKEPTVIATVPPLIANMYYFLLNNTSDNVENGETPEVEKVHIDEFNAALAPKTILTSKFKKTSEAILSYVNAHRIWEIELSKLDPYEIDPDIKISYNDAETTSNIEIDWLDRFESFAKQLDNKYEMLLKKKRELFDAKKYRYVNFELLLGDDEWVNAYKYVNKKIKNMDTFFLEVDSNYHLISLIIDSGVIKDKIFFDIFYNAY